MKYVNVSSFLLLFSFTVLMRTDDLCAEPAQSDNLHIDVIDSKIDRLKILQDFADAPLANTIINQAQLDQSGAKKVSDLTRIEASLSESYSSMGYSDSIAIRGIALNSQNNYLRDGLPFLVDAPVHFENKSQIEIIKGTYGLIGGLSSPGGLINYVTEKPTPQNNIKFKTAVTSAGQYEATVGANSAIDTEKKYLYRFDFSGSQLKANLKNSNGKKYLASFSFSAKPISSLSIGSNFEWSRQSQPSQPGFSLLGSKLPTDIQPDTNLNNQPWTLPVVFNNSIATVYIENNLTNHTKLRLSALGQNITTDDRVAFPFGCTAEGNFDRYCSDGTFDVYDFRSENEKRKNNVVQGSLIHQFKVLETENKLSFVLQNRFVSENYNLQAYNFVGVGHINNSIVLNPDSSLTSQNTNRQYTAKEAILFYNIQFQKLNFSTGLKFAQISKQSIRTDSTQETNFQQNFKLPWSVLSYKYHQLLTYVSYSEGIETYVTPNKPSYTSAGQNISDVISRQIELGLLQQNENSFGLSVFQMTRPYIEDAAPNFTADGEQLHRGIELNYKNLYENLNYEISTLWTDSKKQNGKLNTQTNNKNLVNSPQFKMSLNLDYKITAVDGLNLVSNVQYSDQRYVTSDNTITIPPWATLSLGCQYQWQTHNKISFQVDNLTNNSYWKESPTQFGHIYLFPGESRKLTLSYSKDFAD